MRSRQTCFCSSGMRASGVMRAACTMAESSPAWAHSWRNTELRTWRAAGLRPKEMFDSPSVVWTPGRCSLMSRMPSMVEAPSPRLSSMPVPSVRASGSKNRSPGLEAVAVDGDVVDGLGRPELPLGACGPGPPRRCRCTRRRRRTRGRGVRKRSRRVPGASPSSRLTELRMARPPIHWSAVSMTCGSVESIMSGTVAWVAKRRRDLVHVGGAVAADVVDADVEDVGALLLLLAGHRDARVPVAVEHRLAELLGAVGVGALADRQVGELLLERREAVDRGGAVLVLDGARRPG